MAIDRIDVHWDAITEELPEDEHLERAGAHIGYFIEWAFKKGLAPSNPETHDVEEYKKVVNSEISGIQFLIESCDTKFWEEDLNEKGQSFALFAYDTYLRSFEMIVGHKPYIANYNQQDLQSVSEYLDKVYLDYLANPSVEQTIEGKLSFFQRLKGLFSKQG